MNPAALHALIPHPNQPGFEIGSDGTFTETECLTVLGQPGAGLGSLTLLPNLVRALTRGERVLNLDFERHHPAPHPESAPREVDELHLDHACIYRLRLALALGVSAEVWLPERVPLDESSVPAGVTVRRYTLLHDPGGGLTDALEAARVLLEGAGRGEREPVAPAALLGYERQLARVLRQLSRSPAQPDADDLAAACTPGFARLHKNSLLGTRLTDDDREKIAGLPAYVKLILSRRARFPARHVEGGVEPLTRALTGGGLAEFPASFPTTGQELLPVRLVHALTRLKTRPEILIVSPAGPMLAYGGPAQTLGARRLLYAPPMMLPLRPGDPRRWPQAPTLHLLEAAMPVVLQQIAEVAAHPGEEAGVIRDLTRSPQTALYAPGGNQPWQVTRVAAPHERTLDPELHPRRDPGGRLRAGAKESGGGEPNHWRAFWIAADDTLIESETP